MVASLPLPDDAPSADVPRARAWHELPARALDTSAEHPWPVRLLARKIEQYVDRMAPVWVEGQVVQLNRRPGTSTAFLTLRDTDQDMSLPVSAAVRVLDGKLVEEGAHVVVHAKPVFWSRRGTLQLQAREIRPVGVGELLARIEHLRRVLAAEGLFDAARKAPLPFLPGVVGLVCGRESKAEHDVVVNARERWPQVRFEIREVAVQGPHAVQQVGDAIRELDARPEVDVIVVARGGGSVEDLLPFSNETLVRTAAACRTPLVSAIGHETDSPLLDLVADHRASTPTDAAKRIVPDVSEERARVGQARTRIRAAIEGRVAREQSGLDAVRSRPVLASPEVMLVDRAERVAALRDRARRALDTRLVRAAGEVGRLEGQVRALSPASTLERGYAVVQRADGHVVRSPDDAAVGAELRVRLAHGELSAHVLRADREAAS
ncbi:exodeoxyribonuclease VII large subunit [Cellulosimicrobium sp. Marseille-Q4280]|uniref:exodeoxyribonuclease VII large subunit n=1 Tax=Cellulosimicrobium sp. Marseille-Q4280 TaxID=2937992 RepID=UPI00203FE486|nr:exodeoxyribonuclease VII large subunit [Cellulosimicrobium sp. Marseille-Q4280]